MRQMRLQKTDKNAPKPKQVAEKLKSKVVLQDEMAVLVCEGNKLATSGMFAKAAASYTRAILTSGSCSNKIKGEGNYTRAILAYGSGSNKIKGEGTYTRAILASGSCSNKIKGEGNCQGSYTRAILASDPGSNKTLSSLFVKRAACLARSTIFFRDHAYL